MSYRRTFSRTPSAPVMTVYFWKIFLVQRRSDRDPPAKRRVERLTHSNKIMCGIAGIIDLVGQRRTPDGMVQRMSRALDAPWAGRGGFFGATGNFARFATAEHCRSRRGPTANDERRSEHLRRLQRRTLRLRGAARRAHRKRPSLRHSLRYRNHSASLGGSPGRNVGAAARTICGRAVG